MTLAIVVAGVSVHLADTVTQLPSTLGTRSYAVKVTSSVNLPLSTLRVVTNPINYWSEPTQMPGGADALPPLSDWVWTVTTASGANDTANWALSSSGNELVRTAFCLSSTTYDIHGTARVNVPISGSPISGLGLTTPGFGLVLNPGSSSEGPLFPQNDSGYTGLVSGLHPSLMRFGEVDAGTLAHWDNSTDSPVFNFTSLDAAFNLSKAAGAGVLYTFSGGNWGDGNLLPRWMPLQTNLLINWSTASGYLPTLGAYDSYVTVIVDHIHAMGEKVTYWSIGNEMPLINRTVVLAFIGIFNVAVKVIHSVYPNALVGSDVMMNRTYLSLFANVANDVGFLSFHYYPVIGMCIQNGEYCPPQGQGNGTPDKTFWMPYAQMYDENRYYAPTVAAMMWHNYTGDWVPVIDAESNLNGIGGSALNTSTGTDPRQQMLIGAAWDITAMMVGASQNLSAFTYYTMTGLTLPATTISGADGGWGFGMTAEAYGAPARLYAPYWAFHMWAHYITNGAAGTDLNSPQPDVVRAYEASSPSGISVVLVNEVGVPVTIPVTLGLSAFVPDRVVTLDQRSYVETYNTATQSEVLGESGTLHSTPKSTAKTVEVALDGYGVAIVHYNRTTASPMTGPGAAPATVRHASAGHAFGKMTRGGKLSKTFHGMSAPAFATFPQRHVLLHATHPAASGAVAPSHTLVAPTHPFVALPGASTAPAHFGLTSPSPAIPHPPLVRRWVTA